ncbi:hypothetical protein [Saccharibacillus brassicae]|uniref:Uncharacterized protein n=1 Tax=Saccharibacillus brassicae TaxID=2583377 RepID=A0A4Y6UT53_SACBS|nr:hypothetical protein [Saccharibacillus brassicae]QDH20839.1 hypothetical protein FFV09_08250 [Saccharibacillus brassicae]
MEKNIVYLYSVVFNVLKYVSVLNLFKLIRVNQLVFRKVTEPSVRIELWVFFNFALALLSVYLVYFFKDYKAITILLLGYGIIRVFEIVITQINILLFDQYRAERKKYGEIQAAEVLGDYAEAERLRKETAYTIAGFRRMAILLIHNFFEIIFWFTVSYQVIDQSFKIDGDFGNPLGQALYISFVTMTTFGSPNFGIKDNWSLTVISIQSAIGVVMTLLTFARFISLLPQTKSANILEKKQ